MRYVLDVTATPVPAAQVEHEEIGDVDALEHRCEHKWWVWIVVVVFQWHMNIVGWKGGSWDL